LLDPTHVLHAVAAALGVRESTDRELTDTLIEFVRGKSLRVVLDNCEHVVDAAAHLADALLRASAPLHILATSREPLGCVGETTWRVPSLSQPEALRLALQKVAKKHDDPDVWYLVGEMENSLVTAQMAVREAIDICADYAFTPDKATFNAVVIRKTIAAQAMLAAVEKALETVGGGGIFRSIGLERLVRDLHAAQFHSMQPKRQHRFTGRAALGLDPAG